MSWDVVVIGAGHNGLTAAATLAKAGRKVLVLERSAVHGGLSAREEFCPGFHAPGVLQDTTFVRRELIQGLELERHGLRWRSDDPGVFAPQRDARHGGLTLYRDTERMLSGLETHTLHDIAAFKQWAEFVDRVAPFVRGLMTSTPPAVVDPSPGELARLAATGLGLRRLGEADMLELMRVLAMPAADWMAEHFESPLLQALLVSGALQGNFLGPRSAGTSALVLLARILAGPGIVGGPAALTDALLSSARANGAELRLETEVKQLRVAGGRIAAVVTKHGEVIETRAVAASCDPRRTLIDMLPGASLPLTTETAANAYRLRGCTAVLRLALAAPLAFAEHPGERFSSIRTAATLNQLERCFDHLKYGTLPEDPWLDVHVPTLADPSLAPQGRHVVTIHVHGVGYRPGAPRGDDERDLLFERVLSSLERYAPQLSRVVLGQELLLPEDIEARYGVTGGHILHGDQALDQLWVLRPTLDCSRYSTPIGGLFLCGGGSHPGGGVTCAPGALAARRMLWP